MGSSVSLSVGENSVRIKEKPKASKEAEQFSADKKNAPDKWWLKRPETRLGVLGAKNADAKTKQSPTPSPDVSSSMKDFLEREKMCKVRLKLSNIDVATEHFFSFSAVFVIASIPCHF